jgi:hypothetical protein
MSSKRQNVSRMTKKGNSKEHLQVYSESSETIRQRPQTRGQDIVRPMQRCMEVCFAADPPREIEVQGSNRVSQMPCRVSSDVHEWTNEGPAVPIYNPANLRKLDEQSSNFHRGEKSLWSFTAACCCDSVAITERNGEPSKPGLRYRWRQQCNTRSLRLCH